MSTRATYEFIGDNESWTVYKHHDGYPKGGYQWIARALQWAWALPRFEADEFAAAFCAANKGKPDGEYRGGGVCFTQGRDAHGDTEFHYVVTCRNGALYVECWQPERDVKGEPWHLFEEGTLEELLDKHAPEREWVKDEEETPAVKG